MAAYRRGLWRCIRRPPPRLLRGPRLWGNWVQGAPWLQREVLEAQIWGEGFKGWQIHVANFIHTLSQPANPPSILSLCSKDIPAPSCQVGPAMAECPGSHGSQPLLPPTTAPRSTRLKTPACKQISCVPKCPHKCPHREGQTTLL